jgi:shikimate 5-dehydrogenase
LTGKKVLVLGVGGAGRAIAFGAVQAGAEVICESLRWCRVQVTLRSAVLHAQVCCCSRRLRSPILRGRR